MYERDRNFDGPVGPPLPDDLQMVVFNSNK